MLSFKWHSLWILVAKCHTCFPWCRSGLQPTQLMFRYKNYFWTIFVFLPFHSNVCLTYFSAGFFHLVVTKHNFFGQIFWLDFTWLNVLIYLSYGFIMAEYMWLNILTFYICGQIFLLGFSMAEYLWPNILTWFYNGLIFVTRCRQRLLIGC